MDPDIRVVYIVYSAFPPGVNAGHRSMITFGEKYPRSDDKRHCAACGHVPLAMELLHHSTPIGAPFLSRKRSQNVF